MRGVHLLSGAGVGPNRWDEDHGDNPFHSVYDVRETWPLERRPKVPISLPKFRRA